MRIILLIFCLLLFSCKNRRPQAHFSKSHLGYQYKLLLFSDDSFQYLPGHIAKVSAVFKTQSDSVFWDTHNNMNDHYYVRVDSSLKENFIQHFVSKSSAGDSACLLVSPRDFFAQQFSGGRVPFFCENDSVVAVQLKIETILDQNAFEAINDNLCQIEMRQIEAYFGNFRDFELAKDPEGFYWLSRPDEKNGPYIQPGQLVELAYRGQYLNGRYLENSAQNFEFVYGTPDQLIKGLNIVIGRLKLGQNAKIILPSRLAFGEYGSSNGIVPPYTPLIYSIAIFQ